ncbi:MAG: transcriptional repressor LexA [Christensenellales bacterium]|jgi:repressor LexA
MTKRDTMRKMHEILDFIKEYTLNKSYPPSVREICKGMGIKSTATVYYYLNLLEEHNLIKKEGSKNRAIEILSPYKKKRLIDIPLVGRIAAGEPILATENLEDILTLPSDLFPSKEDLFMLKVKGQSMINAGIFDGDIIVVRKQPSADNGQIAVIMLDGEATVKRFYKENGYFRLHPENDAMNDIIVNDAEVLGIVIGLIRQF